MLVHWLLDGKQRGNLGENKNKINAGQREILMDAKKALWLFKSMA